MNKCSKCNEWRHDTFMGEPVVCQCKEFTVIDQDGDEYAVQAMNENGAALKFAEESNVEGDYYPMNESVQITVNGKGFSISAEPDVYYSANAL